MERKEPYVIARTRAGHKVIAVDERGKILCTYTSEITPSAKFSTTVAYVESGKMEPLTVQTLIGMGLVDDDNAKALVQAQEDARTTRRFPEDVDGADREWTGSGRKVRFHSSRCEVRRGRLVDLESGEPVPLMDAGHGPF
jgi:hypothetical protein